MFAGCYALRQVFIFPDEECQNSLAAVGQARTGDEGGPTERACPGSRAIGPTGCGMQR
ncbi:hypothetical protein K438DRAFT_1849048 [Mycena galopus ATCC 62051]|nr:hypothetical protein K438DRAFT_1849048 [Mycena galopus ATCC 62051]